MADVAWRLKNRIQLTTDSNQIYFTAVDAYFGGTRASVDYATLHKLYGGSDENPETRCSPAKYLGTRKRRRRGDPDPAHVSTSYVERQNLNIRMQNRRYTRLTNAFSKKADMLAYSLAITFMYHNFVRVHQSLSTTPAVAEGVVSRVWTVEDVVDMLDAPVFRQKVFSN